MPELDPALAWVLPLDLGLEYVSALMSEPASAWESELGWVVGLPDSPVMELDCQNCSTE